MIVTQTNILIIHSILILTAFMGLIAFEISGELKQRVSNLFFALMLLGTIVGGTYFNIKVGEKNDRWFEAKGELLCEMDPKTIVSKQRGYVHRENYYIKDTEVIEDSICGILK